MNRIVRIQFDRAFEERWEIRFSSFMALNLQLLTVRICFITEYDLAPRWFYSEMTYPPCFRKKRRGKGILDVRQSSLGIFILPRAPWAWIALSIVDWWNIRSKLDFPLRFFIRRRFLKNNTSVHTRSTCPALVGFWMLGACRRGGRENSFTKAVF